MTIIRWDPYRFFSKWPYSSEDDTFQDVSLKEGLDVYETESDVIIKAAVPGISPEKVEVTFEDGMLRIQAREEESKEENSRKKVVYKQQRISVFNYTTTLPRAVEGDKISAEVVNGVVIVKAPIASEAKAKKIIVKAK